MSSDDYLELMRELSAIVERAADAIERDDRERALRPGRFLRAAAELERERLGHVQAIRELHELIRRVIELSPSEADARVFFAVLIEVAARHGRRAGPWR